MKTTTTTKVQRTQEVKTSYGDYKNCCKGKLVIMQTDKPLGVGLLAQSKSIPEKFTVLNHATVEAFKNTSYGWQIVEPIIIAHIDERPSFGKGITLDCMVYDSHYKVIKDYQVGLSGYKILAMPENISPKQLQAIADGKLKDGDEVLVGCGAKVTDDEYKYTPDELFEEKHISYNVELDLKGYVTLHKAEDETWDDIYTRINTIEFNSKIEVFNFLKKHYQSPKRK